LTQQFLLRFRQIGVDVLFGERLSRERRRPGWERLRRGALLAGNVGLRHRPFFDRENGCARLAVGDEDAPELGRLRDDVDGAAVLTERQELRRLREVVVPQIVMYELMVPEPL